jgi:translation initiation factor IF-3
VRILFRGREITHPEIGQGILREVADELSDVGQVEQDARLEGRTMLMLLSPRS